MTSTLKAFSLLMVSLLLSTVTAWAQSTVTAQGRIIDETGEGVIGASVVVQGTTTGAVTDLDGNFSIPNVAVGATLEISYMGYKNVTVKVDGKPIAVTLQEDSQALDEVVVVGYGVMRKSDLTGSVTSVKAEDVMKNNPTSDISSALQGRMAGVSIMSSSGQPGSSSTIRIRGMNSISGDEGPLVVIDGFIGGSLNSLNAADIASVEVLKDASATAIYGSRGANGVILVTTKNPQAGKTKVEYNGYINFKTPYSLPETLNPGQMADLANTYGMEIYGQPNYFYTDDEVAAFKRGEGGYDYMGNIFRNVAIEHNHELSISGGSEKTKYLFSMSYNHNDGTVENSSAERFNYRLKVDTEIRSWLKAGFNLWGSYQKSQGPRFSQYRGVLLETMTFPTTIEPKDAEGNYNNYDLFHSAKYNPMGHIWEIDTDGYDYYSRLQGYVDVKIVDGLTFRMTQGFMFRNNWAGNTYGADTYQTVMAVGTTSANIRFRPNYSWTNQDQLTYVKEFNRNHRLNITAVFEQQFDDSFDANITARNLVSTAVGFNNPAFASTVEAPITREKSVMMSLLGRINYVLMDRYMITASWRYDGSSRLADGNRWEQFPSVALAWNVKQEGFLQDVDWLSQLKIRAGYGETGNQAIDNYMMFTQLNAQYDANNNLSITTERLGEPTLRWERTTQWNGGIDLGFFNNRLTITADVYRKMTKDLLLNVNAPMYTAYPSRLRNAGNLLNKGFEITIGADPVATDKVHWNTQLTLSKNQTIVDKLSGDADYAVLSGGYENNYFRLIEGERVGTIWGYVSDGLWQPDDPEVLSGEQVAGTYRFKNMDDDPKITAEDQTIIGNGQPKFNWGWNNTVTWNNFDFSMFIMGVHGFDIYNYTREGSMYLSSGTIQLGANPEWLNRWTPENQNTDIAGFVNGGNVNYMTPSSMYVEKGDFVKIKSITVGYTLPQSAVQKLRINNLRVYASVQNPFMITGYSGLDPETSQKTPLTPGIDWGYYPNGRNFLLGLNFSF